MIYSNSFFHLKRCGSVGRARAISVTEVILLQNASGLNYCRNGVCSVVISVAKVKFSKKGVSSDYLLMSVLYKLRTKQAKECDLCGFCQAYDPLWLQRRSHQLITQSCGTKKSVSRNYWSMSVFHKLRTTKQARNVTYAALVKCTIH